jgi:hypothetical protein
MTGNSELMPRIGPDKSTKHHDPVKLLLLPQLIQKDAVKGKQIASNAV